MKISWERVLDLTLWVLQIFLAVVFLFFGASKFNQHVTYWVDLYDKIGIGQWFRYFTGGLETICAFLLLIPRTARIASLLLASTMVGAILIHVFILHDGYAAMFPGIPLFMLIAIIWKRSSRSAMTKN